MSVIPLLANQSALALEVPKPLLAAGTPAWFEIVIQLLPSLGLFFLGLIVGILLFRKKSGDPEGDPAVADSGDAEFSESSEETQSKGEDSPVIASETAKASGVMEGELAASRELCARQSEEIELLNERFSVLHQQIDEKQQRIGELAAAAESSGSRGALAHARLPLMHLEDVMRTERQNLGAGLTRIERLEARLIEEETKLGEGEKSLAKIRADLESRIESSRQGSLLEGVASRFAHVDDQLRVLHQNISGCVKRAATAREHLETEQATLRDAGRPLPEAISLVESGADSPEASGEALDQIEKCLGQTRCQVEVLQNGIDQEMDEMMGRIDWAVRDSSSGFLKAIDQLNESDSGGDIGVTMLESEVWRHLGELRGSLAGVKLTLETGAAAAPPTGCGKRRLITALDRAESAVEVARNLPMEESVDETGGETVAPSDVVDEANLPEASTSSHPADPIEPESAARMKALTEEMETLRFSAAARDGKIAQLQQALAERESEIESLQKLVDDQPAESVTNVIEFADANPIAARLKSASLPGEKSLIPLARSSGGGGKFIRKLLGLRGSQGDFGRRLIAGSNRAEAVAPIPVASLAEAQVALSELRRAPVAFTDPADKSENSKGERSNGKHFPSETGSSKDTEAEETASLRAKLKERDAQIARLEMELAAQKKGLL